MYKDIQLYIAGEMCEFLKELPPRPRLLAKESWFTSLSFFILFYLFFVFLETSFNFIITLHYITKLVLYVSNSREKEFEHAWIP